MNPDQQRSNQIVSPATTALNEPHRQVAVYYHKRFISYNDPTCHLSWTSSNTIRLVNISTKPPELIFDVPINQIAKFAYGAGSWALIRLSDGREFSVQFGADTTAKGSEAFTDQMATSTGNQNLYENSGEARWWLYNLQRFGVKTKVGTMAAIASPKLLRRFFLLMAAIIIGSIVSAYSVDMRPGVMFVVSTIVWVISSIIVDKAIKRRQDKSIQQIQESRLRTDFRYQEVAKGNDEKKQL